MSTTVTYYFNSYNVAEAWESTPENMVDGSIDTDASTVTDGKVQLLNGNTCDGTDLGTISKVEIRLYGSVSTPTSGVYFRPVFIAGDGNNHNAGIDTTEMWQDWVAITTDTNAPGTWAWTDVQSLDCDVYYSKSSGGTSIAKVEIRVTYTEGGGSSGDSIATITGIHSITL